MKAGPKPAVDSSPLPLRGSRRRELAVAPFALDYVRVPAATVCGALSGCGPGSAR
jgi:hypothetical protein